MLVAWSLANRRAGVACEERLTMKNVANRAHYFDFRTGSTEHPSLVSDPIPEFIYKKMERRWALKFAEGSVKIGSLFEYRDCKDKSGMIVDPHEGLEQAEVTSEMASDPMILMMIDGDVPPVGMPLYNQDDRRLVFCASESTSVPSEALPPEYDTWVQIAARPSIALIHEALLNRVPDVEGPVFKKVVYDPAIDGPDDSPPVRPFFTVMNNSLGLHDRWFTKRTKFKAQGEVRVGWLADPEVCSSPIPPLVVVGLQDYVTILD
jgi:hypothetical protein